MSDAPHSATVSVLGHRLRVASWRLLDGDHGGRRPLVIFNGLGINLEVIAPIAAALPERAVVTFDMPGIGKSPEPLKPYTPAGIAAVTDSLLARMEIDRVDLLGLSWGGWIAQQFALQHRERVGRMALAATSAGMAMVPGNLRMLTRLADPREYTLPRTLQRNLAMLYNGGGDGRAIPLNAVTPPSPVGWLYQLAAVAGWTSAPLLPALDVPTLILAGSDDHVVPPINARLMAALIPDSRVVTFRGGGHLFMLADIARFAAELRGFLDQDLSPVAAAA